MNTNKSYLYTEKYKLISDKAVIRLSDGAIAQAGEKILTYDNENYKIKCIEVSWDGSTCTLITDKGFKIDFDKIFVFKEFRTPEIPLDGYRISGRRGNGSIHSVVRERDDSLIVVGDVGIIENAPKNILFGDLYKIEYFLISKQRVVGVSPRRIGNFGLKTFKKESAGTDAANDNDSNSYGISYTVEPHPDDAGSVRYEVPLEATADQPEPESGGGTKILDLVLSDLQERAEMGKKKYGTYLEAHNGRDALIDAYQEALDLVMYLRQEIEERKSNKDS